mmetsp:Transcript_16778/g.50267  ORF Transcript_16778/g.50267 Transcript_16778/m.50267 type:complete len:186 (-) Transcript_16778:62-619(-)
MADPVEPAERHPTVMIFHWLFKAAAIVWFLLCTFFIKGFVLNFVISIVLIALDFWTVKNVTGRKLVGLRWWNEANDSGSAWRFESAPEGSRNYNPSEKTWFWVALVGNVGAWAALALMEIFRLKFDYLIIPIIGLTLGSSNLVGYFKCSREAKDQLQSMTTSIMTSAATSYVTNAVRTGGGTNAV